MVIWAKIVSWFVGGGLSSIGEQLNVAYKNRLNAMNAHERIEAEKEIAHLSARRDVLLSEQSLGLTRWIRPAFAFPFIVYNFKVVVYDLVLGLGETAGLPDAFWQLQMIIFGAYFLTRPLERLRRK